MTVLPLFCRDATAAKMLDMSTKRFRDLVAAGSLPAPVSIGGEERWDREEITAVVRGAQPDLSGGLDL